MSKWAYLIRRLFGMWKRTRLIAYVLTRRLLFRLLSNDHLLSFNENVTVKPLSLQATDRILVLAPHSDDESIGCGALLLSYAPQVSVACLTNGAKGVPYMPKAEVVQMRERELRTALSLAGVEEVTFLGIEDRELASNLVQFSQLSVSDKEWIFIPNFLDQHPDHKAVTPLLQSLLTERGYSPNLKIVFYEIWGALPVWNAYLALDEMSWHKKQNLIACFQSQVKQIDYASRIYGLHTYRGIAAGLPAVEAYLVLDVQDFLAIQSTH